MKIRHVSSAVVEANFDWTIVRIETDSGLVGWGESFFAPGLTAILEQLGELLIGRDARDTERIVARLLAAASGAGSSGGIVLNAISGLDAALWDLNARALDAPLWQLLGGRYHESVRLYADCHAGGALMSLGPLLDARHPGWVEAANVVESTAGLTFFDPGVETEAPTRERLAASAAFAVAAGFDALKFDVDVPGLLPARHGSRSISPAAIPLVRVIVDAIRDGAGPAIDIALDCHWRYDLAAARLIADAVADAGLLWLEDPLPPENLSGLVALSRATATPLATGENLSRWPSFAPLVESHAVSVVTPDFGKVGGLHEGRLIASNAAARGIGVAPHNIAGPVGTLFAAQVASTMPNLVALEFHALEVPFFADLVDAPVVVDGAVAIGDRPGIGAEVNVDAVREWSKAGVEAFAGAGSS